MDKFQRKRETVPEGLFEGLTLIDRLQEVRKRRRAFSGRTMDVEALRRRLREEQRRNRDP